MVVWQDFRRGGGGGGVVSDKDLRGGGGGRIRNKRRCHVRWAHCEGNHFLPPPPTVKGRKVRGVQNVLRTVDLGDGDAADEISAGDYPLPAKLSCHLLT
jgi:hypothetical protein